MTDNDRRQGLFGNPYVGWSPRPTKNGQPPSCYGQCNLNIGARKVGAAMKRLPQIQMGPKAKEQILQKWDPTSRRMVIIYQSQNSHSTGNNPSEITYSAVSGGSANDNYTNYVLGGNASSEFTIYIYGGNAN